MKLIMICKNIKQQKGTEDMNNKTKIGLAIAGLLLLMWWFRFDTHCGTHCVSYDRFMGKWVIPVYEAK